jgi:hypothetical protein
VAQFTDSSPGVKGFMTISVTYLGEEQNLDIYASD